MRLSGPELCRPKAAMGRPRGSDDLFAPALSGGGRPQTAVFQEGSLRWEGSGTSFASRRVDGPGAARREASTPGRAANWPSKRSPVASLVAGDFQGPAGRAFTR